jgi:hypothetical protein
MPSAELDNLRAQRRHIPSCHQPPVFGDMEHGPLPRLLLLHLANLPLMAAFRCSRSAFRASVTMSRAWAAMSPSRAAPSGMAGADRDHPGITAPREARSSLPILRASERLIRAARSSSDRPLRRGVALRTTVHSIAAFGMPASCDS